MKTTEALSYEFEKHWGCEWPWLSFDVLGRPACIVHKNLEIGKDYKNRVHQ